MKMIKNRAKGTVLARRIELAKGLLKKGIGLMFRGEIEDGCCLLMEFSGEGSYGIWMFGMRFSIDLVFLDSEKKVVGIFENVRPLGLNPCTWKIYRPKRPAKWILELKAGTVKRTRTAPRDRLVFG